MSIADLDATARALVPSGRGILASDDGLAGLEKRFSAHHIPFTPDHRRAYRQMLFTTPGMAEWISGVILLDETLTFRADDGRTLTELLAAQGIIPGVKADTGPVPLEGSPEERITTGLDGMPARLADARARGARFAKWRAVISVGPGRPSRWALRANAHALARYAAIAQGAGLVPIVEPDVLMDGDHAIEDAARATRAALVETYAALHDAGVRLSATLLKPNMVLAGYARTPRPGAAEVAAATLAAFRDTVPAAVPGIVFLSGGQSDPEATQNLHAINAAPGPKPWELSFSYGRALQSAALAAWGGDPARIAAGQRVFAHRARMNALARQGRWSPEMEKGAA